MTTTRKTLRLLYLLIAVLALIGTWGHNIEYLSLGLLGANKTFWQETLVNPASRSITIDLFFLVLAAAVWMLLEARRLGMRFVWLYLLFGVLVAISVTFPLFLIHRENALAQRDSAQVAGTLGKGDILGLVVLSLLTLAYMLHSFRPGP